MCAAAVLSRRRTRQPQLPGDALLRVVLAPRGERAYADVLDAACVEDSMNVAEKQQKQKLEAVCVPAFVPLPARSGYNSAISKRFMERYSSGLIARAAASKPVARKPVRGFQTEVAGTDYVCGCCGRDDRAAGARRKGWKPVNEGGPLCLCPDCFLLESIITHKWKGSKCWFRVKWLGCDEYSWVPEEHVHRDMIEVYFHAVENKRSTQGRKRRRTSADTGAARTRKRQS